MEILLRKRVIFCGDKNLLVEKSFETERSPGPTYSMRKAMVQLNELDSGLAAESSAQSLNQMMMMRWVIVTKEEFAKKIINLVAVECLCHSHKVKREAFACDEDYFAALHSHHAVMQAAMKAKQSANTAAADALDYAIEDFAKMYIKE